MLQTGEYEQFTHFADKQRQQAEIEELAYIGPEGVVELASPASLVGQAIDADVWETAQDTEDGVVVEDESCYSMYTPLRVTADMHRLQPHKEVGQLYGLLHVKLSKEKINAMLAAARGQFQSGVRQVQGLSVALGAAALVIMAITLLPLVVRPLVRSLKNVITTMTARANNLANISQQLAGSSERLADSASQQASFLEETSSALEEMAATTSANAESAQEANRLASQAQHAAAEGNETVGRLNQAMDTINESARGIGKIIKVIEEIAFQTNLLALNAAVEAARAGEHGKGFAVVAEEVRSLAQRAADAARQTTQLIEDSVQRAGDGTQVARDVGQSLANIMNDATHVSELVGGITKASQEQAQGAKQVNAAVSQMDRVTQRNAVDATESSTLAQQLNGQAQAVKGTVDELVTLVGRRCSHRISVSRSP